MGCKDDAAGMARPMLGIERRVMFGQVGIAGIPEDRLDKVEIADHVPGSKEICISRVLLSEKPGTSGTTTGLSIRDANTFALFSCECVKGSSFRTEGRVKRLFQQQRECLLRYGFFIKGYRESRPQQREKNPWLYAGRFSGCAELPALSCTN